MISFLTYYNYYIKFKKLSNVNEKKIKFEI